MATKLEKAIVRETNLIYKNRPVMIRITPDHVELWPKGMTKDKGHVTLEQLLRISRRPD